MLVAQRSRDAVEARTVRVKPAVDGRERTGVAARIVAGPAARIVAGPNVAAICLVDAELGRVMRLGFFVG